MDTLQEIIEISTQLQRLIEIPKLHIESSKEALAVLQSSRGRLQQLVEQYKSILQKGELDNFFLAKLQSAVIRLDKVFENLDTPSRNFNSTKSIVRAIDELNEFALFLRQNSRNLLRIANTEDKTITLSVQPTDSKRTKTSSDSKTATILPFRSKQDIESTLNNGKQNTTNKVIKILILTANPQDTGQIRLDEEIHAIDQALHQAKYRDKFETKQHWAVRVSELQGYFLRYEPTIVHFSGHGSESSEIILEDNNGNSQPVSTRALSKLFSVLKDNIRCVVLNACFSDQQARAIAEHIDCVVGMSNTIGNKTANSFAAGFYQALGYGRDVKTAFESGCAQIDLEGLDEQNAPKLLAINCKPEEIFFV